MAYQTRSNTLKLQRLIEVLRERGSDLANSLESSASVFFEDVKPKSKPPVHLLYDSDDGSSYCGDQDQDDESWGSDWEEDVEVEEEPSLVPLVIEEIPPVQIEIKKEPTPPPLVIKEPSPPPKPQPQPKEATPPPPQPQKQKPKQGPTAFLSDYQASKSVPTPLMKFTTHHVNIPSSFGATKEKQTVHNNKGHQQIKAPPKIEETPKIVPQNLEKIAPPTILDTKHDKTPKTEISSKSLEMEIQSKAETKVASKMTPKSVEKVHVPTTIDSKSDKNPAVEIVLKPQNVHTQTKLEFTGRENSKITLEEKLIDTKPDSGPKTELLSKPQKVSIQVKTDAKIEEDLKPTDVKPSQEVPLKPEIKIPRESKPADDTAGKIESRKVEISQPAQVSKPLVAEVKPKEDVIVKPSTEDKIVMPKPEVFAKREVIIKPLEEAPEVRLNRENLQFVKTKSTTSLVESTKVSENIQSTSKISKIAKVDNSSVKTFQEESIIKNSTVSTEGITVMKETIIENNNVKIGNTKYASVTASPNVANGASQATSYQSEIISESKTEEVSSKVDISMQETKQIPNTMQTKQPEIKEQLMKTSIELKHTETQGFSNKNTKVTETKTEHIKELKMKESKSLESFDTKLTKKEEHLRQTSSQPNFQSDLSKEIKASKHMETKSKSASHIESITQSSSECNSMIKSESITIMSSSSFESTTSSTSETGTCRKSNLHKENELKFEKINVSPPKHVHFSIESPSPTSPTAPTFPKSTATRQRTSRSSGAVRKQRPPPIEQPQAYQAPEGADIPEVGGQRSRKPTLASQWRKQKEKQRMKEQSLINRLETFATWPAAEGQTEEEAERLAAQIAEAGFYFIGLNDSVQCSQCGLVLNEWRTADDPWLRHGQESLECSFLIEAKGQHWLEELSNLEN